MIKLTKGDAVKALSSESVLIDFLKSQGWTVEGEKSEAVSVDAPRRGRPPKEKPSK